MADGKEDAMKRFLIAARLASGAPVPDYFRDIEAFVPATFRAWILLGLRAELMVAAPASHF
jgi:hypothetical protein